MLEIFRNPGAFGQKGQSAFPPAFLNMMQASTTFGYILMGVTALLAMYAAECIRDREHWVWVIDISWRIG